ncbi:MAG: 1-acyl-sn-glycerol-3-phosphate acyltransferase [Leptospiraceae bacterium]|nr:1-acyl-sn-glycerol-3-phosphate acyltransferase [Leptospiraceae bacterium]MDW8305719.1 1-acyl-sn-glycerol-3-phosphate acyltransferase [Leptospiraceae bacterium]
MSKDIRPEPVTHAPWVREFYKNIEIFVAQGLSEQRARELLTKYLQLSQATPMPRVMETFEDESKLDEVGVYTERRDEIRDFMMEFLDPLLRNFTLEGTENLRYILPLLGKYPITIISNHLSHMDTAAMYGLLYRQGGEARKLADSMVFIAGRLVFLPDITRLGVYMIHSLLVCSKRDMIENPAMADLMTRINMRSFRMAHELQKQGKVIAIFPEGTRSRTGKLLGFVDTVYHYVTNKIIVPFSLTGTDKILPTDSFLFNIATGKVSIGRPILVGKLPPEQMKSLPDSVDRLEVPDDANKKQFIIDNLALLVGQNLHRHMHGTYRNLYQSLSFGTKENILISRPKEPKEHVAVIGHSPYGVAYATVMANHPVEIKIYIPDKEKAALFNELRLDQDHFPLFKLPPNISFTANPEDLRKATIYIQAARSWEIDDYYRELAPILQENWSPIINVVKGFTSSRYGLIFDDLEHIYGLNPVRFCALAGANYPDQIMERKPTGFEFAAINTSLVQPLTRYFNTGYTFTRAAYNPYDVRGMQLGGALKNIYALGIGLLDGYYEKNLGGNSDNTLFHFSHRIFQEMTRLGVALGGRKSTFAGLSGMTDLMLSCFGQDARDRQWGHDFIYGKASKEKKLPGLHGIQALARLVHLSYENYPIARGIYDVIVEGKDIEEVMEATLEKIAMTSVGLS